MGRSRDTDGDTEEDRFDDDEPGPKKKKRRTLTSTGDDIDDTDEGEKPRKKKKKKILNADDVLGARKQVFTPNLPKLRLISIGCIALFLIGVGSCFLSMFTSVNSAVIVMTIVGVPGGLLGLYWCVNYLTLKVTLCSGGIIHEHRGRERNIPWEEIRFVTQTIREYNNEYGARPVTEAKYTIELEDRTTFVFTSRNLQEVEKLGHTIIEKTAAVLLPIVRRQYESGKTVDFGGKMSLNKEGIHTGRQVMKWKDIQGVRIHEGLLSINKRGTWLAWENVPASTFPNLEVFLTFVTEIVGVKSE